MGSRRCVRRVLLHYCRRVYLHTIEHGDGISSFCAARFYIVAFNQSLSRQPTGRQTILQNIWHKRTTYSTAGSLFNKRGIIPLKIFTGKATRGVHSHRLNDENRCTRDFVPSGSMWYKLFLVLAPCDGKMDFRVRASLLIRSAVAGCRLLVVLRFSIACRFPSLMPHVSEWIFGQSHITRFTCTRSIRSSRTTTAAPVCVCVCVLSKIWKRIRGPVTVYNLHRHDDYVMR